MATPILGATEGGLILARARRDLEPLAHGPSPTPLSCRCVIDAAMAGRDGTSR
jgi:hypothetical protein